MNHSKQDTRPSPGGRQQRQEEAPSKLEQQARGEDRGREGFTKAPVRASSEQPDVTTEPERLSANEIPKDAERDKLEHPPARESERPRQ